MFELVVWSVQIFLALFFLMAGAPKILGRGIERWTGFSDLPRPLVIFIGITEVLGALALVLPMATGMATWITPLSAAGLGIIALMAAGFHLRNDERLEAIETTLWASIAAVLAISRWNLVMSVADVPSWVAVAALSVLVPSAIVNVIVLLRRPVRSEVPASGPTY